MTAITRWGGSVYHHLRRGRRAFAETAVNACNRVADRYLSGRGRHGVVYVNGFWRSGTTFFQTVLAESIKAKTIFEPFEPGLPHEYRFIARYNDATDLDYRRVDVVSLMPTITPSSEPLIRSYFARITSGDYEHDGYLLNRSGPFEGLRPRVCIKSVRSHFILDWLSHELNYAIVHLVRNPLSVVASLVRRPGWNQGGFDDLSLDRLLMGPDKRALPFYDRYASRLRSLPPTLSKVEKVTAYWCATEIAAAACLEGVHDRWLVVSYEEVVSRQNGLLLDICRTLDIEGCRAADSAYFEEMSVTSSTSAKQSADYDPEKAYLRVLSPSDIQRVEGILDHFGFAEHRSPTLQMQLRPE